jgi:hypothetical protein
MDRDHVEDAFSESFDDLPDDLRELLGRFHMEEMYHVTGATYADNLRHGCARVALLDCLAEDPQVLAHLESWGREIGLIQAAEEVASLGEEAAQLCGVGSRWEVWRREEHEPLGPPDEARDQALLRLTEAFERFLEAFRRSTEVLEAACAFVRDELRLPWVWLAWELTMMLLLEAFQEVLGIEVCKGLRYIPEDPPAADFSWTFTTRPGETVSAAQQRFNAEAHTAFVQIQPVPDAPEQIPLGRQRQDLEELARRNAQWFYRHKVRQEPISRIARDCHVSRVNVYDGIKKAEQVLSLTTYVFGEPQEET